MARFYIRGMSRAAKNDLAQTRNELMDKHGFTGWTTAAYGPEAGKPVTDAYSVALDRATVERPANSPITGQGISRYQRRFQHLLRQPGYYHGGWVPQGGVGAQDVTMVYPRTREGYGAALQHGAVTNQQAIGDLGTEFVDDSNYKGDINVPEHLWKGQYEAGNPNAYPEQMQVTSSRNSAGKEVISIIPSRSEMVDVEAESTWTPPNA